MKQVTQKKEIRSESLEHPQNNPSAGQRPSALTLLALPDDFLGRKTGGGMEVKSSKKGHFCLKSLKTSISENPP